VYKEKVAFIQWYNCRRSVYLRCVPRRPETDFEGEKNEPDHFSITGDSIIQAGREQKILFTLDATPWGGTKRRLELSPI